MRPVAVIVVLALLGAAKLYQLGLTPEVPGAAAGPVQLPNDWRTSWALDFLTAMGNPQPSVEIVATVIAWSKAEDGSDGAIGRFNPLNTSEDMGAVGTFNSHGVKAYGSWEDGIAATVQTLTYTYAGYAEIVSGLQTNTPQLVIDGLSRGSWGTDAGDVATLYPQVLASFPVAAAATPAGQKCLPTESGTVGANYYSTGDVWASLGQPGGQHLGTDYLGEPGTVVYAPLPFVVEAVGSYSDPRTAGVFVQGRFDDGYLFYAGHLAESYVSAGQRVAACQPIGTIGALAHTHIKMNPPGAPEPCEGSGRCEDFEAYIAAR